MRRRNWRIAWHVENAKGTLSSLGPWSYKSADGSTEIMRVFRIDQPGGKKKFLPTYKDHAGWHVGDPLKSGLPLYHLDELAAADTVFVLEGEKCADLVRVLGLVATTASHGSSSPQKTDWSPLAGKTVVLIPDNDKAGEKYIATAAGILVGLQPKPVVKVLRLELENEGDDIEQWVGAGGTVDQLRDLAAKAGAWEAPVVEQAIDNRPEIRITTHEKDVNDLAVAALASDPELYRLGYVLATILQEGDAPRGVQYKDGPPPQISPIGEATLRERMAQTAQWKVLKPNGVNAAGEPMVKVVPAPPSGVVRQCRSQAWHLAGRASHRRRDRGATIRCDGSILSSPGYDPATRLYLRPNIEVGPIPDRPTKIDAEVARDLILDLVCDFPFKNLTHQAMWLSGLLTVIARASFDGPAPLFALDGNCPGSGKTKLADLIAITASGRRMPRSIWPSTRHGDDEVRKRITSMALAGERFALLDNLDSPLGGAALDAALTGDTWKDRTLGVSTAMTAELPLRIVWFASGNNVQYRGDFLRRVLPCRLESPLENPEERTGFKYPSLLTHALQKRTTILRSARWLFSVPTMSRGVRRWCRL